MKQYVPTNEELREMARIGYARMIGRLQIEGSSSHNPTLNQKPRYQKPPNVILYGERIEPQHVANHSNRPAIPFDYILSRFEYFISDPNFNKGHFDQFMTTLKTERVDPNLIPIKHRKFAASYGWHF